MTDLYREKCKELKTKGYQSSQINPNRCACAMANGTCVNPLLKDKLELKKVFGDGQDVYPVCPTGGV